MKKPTVQPTGVKRVGKQNDDEEDEERERESYGLDQWREKKVKDYFSTTESLKAVGEKERATERRCERAGWWESAWE